MVSVHLTLLESLLGLRTIVLVPRFDSLVDEVAVFRRPLGVAALDLSAALHRDDLWVFEADNTELNNYSWDAPAAPLWQPVATDTQRAADIFARLPQIIADCGIDGGCEEPCLKNENDGIRSSDTSKLLSAQYRRKAH